MKGSGFFDTKIVVGLKAGLVYGLLTGVSAVLAAGVCELLLRNFFPQPLYKFEKGLFVPDPGAGYRLAPLKDVRHTQPDYTYIIHTNSLGFRGPEPKRNAAVRVLIAGDSVGFGQGVAEGDTFSDLMRAHFSAQRVDFDLLNTSVPGYALMNEKRVLADILPVYAPHLVLLFFNWNDVGVTESLKVVDGYLVLGEGFKLGWLREYLNNHSHLYALVKQAYYRLSAPRGDAYAAPSFSREVLHEAAAQLREVNVLCGRAHAAFRVFIVPPAWTSAQNSSWPRTKRQLLQRLTDSGVLYTDLEDSLSNMPDAQRRELTFRHDLHWNEAGHKYFAQPIIQVTEEALMQATVRPGPLAAPR